MGGLVPERNPAQQRVREGAWQGVKTIFCLTAAARAAPRPQDHARCCELGLAV
jgi:hypothetical protein